MLCLMYDLLFLRQLLDCIQSCLGEGIARHLTRGQLVGASRPGGDMVCVQASDHHQKQQARLADINTRHERLHMTTESCTAAS